MIYGPILSPHLFFDNASQQKMPEESSNVYRPFIASHKPTCVWDAETVKRVL